MLIPAPQAFRRIRFGDYEKAERSSPLLARDYKDPADLVAFDRTKGVASGDITGPLRVSAAATDGVNDAKADHWCVGPVVTAFDWKSSAGATDESFKGKGRNYIVRKGDYAQLRASAIDAVAGGFGVRRLTPVECERLQGFPDGWTAGLSDSQRYARLGNAVCVSVARWIGRRLVTVSKDNMK